jgi:hypothetical protein
LLHFHVTMEVKLLQIRFVFGPLRMNQLDKKDNSGTLRKMVLSHWRNVQKNVNHVMVQNYVLLVKET